MKEALFSKVYSGNETRMQDCSFSLCPKKPGPVQFYQTEEVDQELRNVSTSEMVLGFALPNR